MAMAISNNWQSGKTLSQSASFMLDNEIATDVTFKFPNSDETIKAHRLILMARSQVFYVMFNSRLDKPGEDIEISDIEPATFKELLKYLYSDGTALSVDRALDLTYCAEKYGVTDLKAKCTDFLLSQVDETTVAMVLNHAVLYNDDALITTCRDIIEPLETLSCLEEHHVTKDTMALVLGFEGLSVREVDIFEFCNTWAENECKRMEVAVNGSNRRKMLGPLLRKIPFCSMTNEEFATEVSGKHLLNGQEELQIYRFISAPDKSNPPFACKPKIEIKKPFIAVKLPKSMYRTNLSNSPFALNISCSRPCKLLGLGFTQAGSYNIRFGNRFNENFINLQGFLKIPMKFHVAGLTIESLPTPTDLRMELIQNFSHVEYVKGQECPVQLGFEMHSDGIPCIPFDTLIVQSRSASQCK